MIVFEHGNTYHTTECPVCGCQFGYVKKDMQFTAERDVYEFGVGEVQEIKKRFVNCPECGEPLYQSYNRKINGWWDSTLPAGTHKLEEVKL